MTLYRAHRATCDVNAATCNNLTRRGDRHEISECVDVLHWPCGHAMIQLSERQVIPRPRAGDDGVRYAHPADIAVGITTALAWIEEQGLDLGLAPDEDAS